MKLAVVITVAVSCALLIGWIRSGDGFHIAQVLPFLGGYRPGLCDIGAIVMLLIVVWRIRRSGAKGRNN